VAGPRDEKPLRNAARHAGRPGSGRKAVLALTFLFALAAVSVSTGLVVYTAWNYDLKNGLFALSFAVLSARATLSWVLWRDDVSNLSPPHIALLIPEKSSENSCKPCLKLR
jgi:hypothetical protein